MINNKHKSSFRDPSGYIFSSEKGEILRKIFPIYFNQYYKLKETNFYQKLFANKLLIPHEELLASKDEIILKPEPISFFSFPYEWCFLQYKLAALHTLKLQKYSLENGFTLKDASAFNITFQKGKPIFIDTLSFDFYIENEPWRAYKQFISHFLAPLLLTKYYGSAYLKLLSHNVEGMSINEVAKILPFYARFNPIVYSNIYLLAKFEKKFSNDSENISKKSILLSKKSQIRIIESLYNFIKNLKSNENSEWENYYNQINYDSNAFDFKKKLIANWINDIGAKKIIDLGGNDGTFSRVLTNEEIDFIVCDIDANAVESNMKQVIRNKEENIMPLVIDLLNPSPSIGFSNAERSSFFDRVKEYKPNLVLSLALIHHITLTGNVPFEMTAEFFSKMTPYLIIEFPDKKDSWVQFLLKSKKDFKYHFDDYCIDNFEKVYSVFFDTLKKNKIENTDRTMYLFKSKFYEATK